MLICILTAVTQIGGIVLLISLATFGPIDKRIRKRGTRVTVKAFSFTLVYLLFAFGVVPPAAKFFGRVPLPVFETGNLKPVTAFTCLLNRHYVTPRLRDITYKVAEDIGNKFPGTTINYLDANFPFINKFPLFPHLSHDDGKKLDLSFQYNDSRTGEITNDVPSFIGYGICEEPRPGEEDKPGDCHRKGYWQYNLLRNRISQANKEKFILDNERTKALISSFASRDGVGKIFIEPHLRARLGLSSNKIRFHGCQAVRHDDHIHVQLK